MEAREGKKSLPCGAICPSHVLSINCMFSLYTHETGSYKKMRAVRSRVYVLPNLHARGPQIASINGPLIHYALISCEVPLLQQVCFKSAAVSTVLHI